VWIYIIAALVATTMGFGAGYLLLGFFWAFLGWWWKSLNLWRVVLAFYTFYILSMLVLLIFLIATDVSPDSKYTYDMGVLIVSMSLGYLAFFLVNKRRFARKSVGLR